MSEAEATAAAAEETTEPTPAGEGAEGEAKQEEPLNEVSYVDVCRLLSDWVVWSSVVEGWVVVACCIVVLGYCPCQAPVPARDTTAPTPYTPVNQQTGRQALHWEPGVQDDGGRAARGLPGPRRDHLCPRHLGPRHGPLPVRARVVRGSMHACARVCECGVVGLFCAPRGCVGID
jgi:hypothetical protein